MLPREACLCRTHWPGDILPHYLTLSFVISAQWIKFSCVKQTEWQAIKVDNEELDSSVLYVMLPKGFLWSEKEEAVIGNAVAKELWSRDAIESLESGVWQALCHHVIILSPEISAIRELYVGFMVSEFKEKVQRLVKSANCLVFLRSIISSQRPSAFSFKMDLWYEKRRAGATVEG